MTPHVFLMIAVMALVVILLRFFPFLVFSSGKKVPPLLLYFGRVMTAAAIAMLAVYSLFGNLNWSGEGAGRLPAALCASVLTVVLHLLFRNPLVSILAGTGIFMVLIRL